MRRIVVAGASRGLGAALAAALVSGGDQVVSLSRSPASQGRWLCCDLADPKAIEATARAIEGPVDALIVTAGIWEAAAFSPQYRLADSDSDEISRILTVNLLAPVLLARALAPQLAGGGKVVLVGSTSGLDNIGTPEVAYNASKAGLRGAAQALARALQGERIAVSVLNPGDFATPDVLAAKAQGRMRPEGSLPMADLLAAVNFLLGLSPDASFCEIDLFALAGR